MASRSAIYDDDFNSSSAESSPDPLSRSINENTPYNRRAATRTTKQALISSSPSKQNRGQSIGEFEIPSPSKSMVLNTPRGTGASPWRIKVTVQAEPEVGDENASSPTVRHVTRTQTKTVPLKDADASSPVKRRGRPRKSDAPSPRTKRSGTPARKTPRPLSKTRDITSESSAVDDTITSMPKKRRGRPRKSLLPSEEETLDEVSQDLNFTTVSVPEEDTSPRKKRGRPRKSLQSCTKPGEANAAVDMETNKGASTPKLTGMVIPVIETTVPTPQSRRSGSTDKAIYPPGNGIPGLANFEYEERMRFTPPQTELSQRIRARKRTPAAKGKTVVEISSDEDSDGESEMNTPSGSDEDAPMGNASQEYSSNHQISHGESMAPTAAIPVADDSDDNDELQDMTGFAFEEGVTKGPDDTTIVESENFSMISIDSLPSSGGLTSPVCGPSGQKPVISNVTVRNHDYLNIPSTSTQPPAHVSAPSYLNVAAVSKVPSPQPPLSRYKTPVMDETTPSNPPPIEASRPSPFEAETPKIGQAVKAGVALQGVLDPSRVTPEAGPSKTIARLSELDDIFSGFSDRTRKELRAGLRLGEQLANENTANKESGSVSSSPLKEKNATSTGPIPQTKEHESRLLTQEEHEHENQESPAGPDPQNTAVQYPALSALASHLPTPSISPARSDEEMSWKVDAPPSSNVTASNGRFLTVRNEHGESLRGKDILVEADKDIEMEDGDVWTVEAVQSTGASNANPFTLDGPVKPARAKLPKTWRRKSSNNFNYSDESEEAAEADPPLAQSGPTGTKATRVEDHDHVAEGSSDASDDTGVFFRKKLPATHTKRTADKLDLSLLMKEGESLLPDSSPPVANSNAPSARKSNPFSEAPPRIAAFSSPVRSSPLRNEIRGSSTEHSQIAFEESTLPLAQSSPFHTIVDDTFSAQSDQRQIYNEMNNSTDSSLRNIRAEANGYVEAYDMREHSLDDITEVTEHSRSFTTQKPDKRSSPQKKTFEESMVTPKGRYAPLFDSQSNPAPTPVAAQSSPLKKPTKKRRTPEPSSTAPQLHPILANIKHLPKVEPWTKTHYKTLDRLFQIHTKNPTLLTPHHSSPSSALNATLLRNFLNETGLPFVGATYSVWGYSITLDEGLVVLCAVYMQLLSLRDIAEYEAKAGRKIQMGDCAPREAGMAIEGEEVVKRLATVIIGDELRRDEKRGVEIIRDGTLQVEWPET